MFPFMSSYVSLLRNANARRHNPWDEVSTPGFGGPRAGIDDRADATRPWAVSGGYERGTDSSGEGRTDADPGAEFARRDRRRTMGAGLTALGSNLLAAAGTGDWTGGLARGAAAFGQAVGEERDRSERERMIRAQEERQRAQDERLARSDDRDAQADELARRRGEAELSAWHEQQERGQRVREQTGKSAEQMVAEIESLAQANPNDPKLQVMARRAAGYSLGEESDLNKLADLHEQMTGQAFRPQDTEFEIQSKIDAERRAIEAGVAPNPRDAERRANAELEISRGHLGVARERLTTDKNDQARNLTLLQTYRDMDAKVAKKMHDKLNQYRDTRKQGQPEEPPQQVLDKWRLDAIAEAQREFGAVLESAQSLTYDPRTGTLR